MNKRYINFVTSLGFKQVRGAVTKHDPQQIQAFRYEEFDPAQVRYTLGRAKAYTQDLFVFVLSRTQAVRVRTDRKTILLGNGKKAVQALLRSAQKD